MDQNKEQFSTTNDLPDFSYMDEEQLKAEFRKLKQQINKMCEPLGDLLRQYAFKRKQFDAFMFEFEKRKIEVNFEIE